MQFTGIDILGLENGRIVERWGESNGLEVMHLVQRQTISPNSHRKKTVTSYNGGQTNAFAGSYSPDG